MCRCVGARTCTHRSLDRAAHPLPFNREKRLLTEYAFTRLCRAVCRLACFASHIAPQLALELRLAMWYERLSALHKARCGWGAVHGSNKQLKYGEVPKCHWLAPAPISMAHGPAPISRAHITISSPHHHHHHHHPPPSRGHNVAWYYCSIFPAISLSAS